VTTLEAVHEHHGSSAGPYGLEMPPDWSYVVTVTEVTVEIKGDSKTDEVNNNAVNKSAP
jgi:hypothetical protein